MELKKNQTDLGDGRGVWGGSIDLVGTYGQVNQYNQQLYGEVSRLLLFDLLQC